MPAKKTVEPAPDIAEFKQKLIELGIKYCEDAKAGRITEPQQAMEAAVRIYEAVNVNS